MMALVEGYKAVSADCVISHDALLFCGFTTRVSLMTAHSHASCTATGVPEYLQ
jgi:hypothetical protein